jgi:hypothetical protein
MINQVKYIFEEVYQKFSGYKLYKLNIEGEIIKKQINSFITLLQQKYRGSIDNHFILHFIVFQFRNYENAKTRLGKGKVYVNWILGKKALKRWENKPENWFYWNNQFIKKYNISISAEGNEANIDSVKFTRSLERNRFKNTEMGLIHCQELDLFDKYCRECIRCTFNNICKK